MQQVNSALSSPSAGSPKELLPQEGIEKDHQKSGNLYHGRHDSARCWSVHRKIWISTGAIASLLVITLSTSIYIASVPGIMREFRINHTLAISPVTLHAMGFIIGPLCTSALSGVFGRQYIYKISLFLHLIFNVGAGLAQNFPTVALCRAFSGLVSSPSATVFSGILDDLWKVSEDKLAVPIFVLCGICGAAAAEIGPVIGEAIVAAYGWRSSFWLIAILVGICFGAMLMTPETLEAEIQRKALRLPRPKCSDVVDSACVRPVHMLFVEPIIFPTAAIVSLSQMVLFVLYTSYPVVLQRVYHFTPYQVGFSFLPLLLGSLMAGPMLMILDKRNHRLPGETPERTLLGAKIAAIALPTSLFWLAWTTRSPIHWSCPLMAGIPYGLGFAFVQIVYPLYRHELYGAELGTSALAIDISMRYMVSCTFPLFTNQVIDRIGFDWFMTLCALATAGLGPVPWGLERFGAEMQSTSYYLRRRQVERRIEEVSTSRSAGSISDISIT